MLMFLMLWPNAITYQVDQGKDMQIITIDFLLARGEKRARGGAREEERERRSAREKLPRFLFFLFFPRVCLAFRARLTLATTSYDVI